MSTLLIIADGISDEPIPSLGGKTPLQVARTPYLDLMSKEGINGTLLTVPEGIEVNSDTATLSILGYDITKLGINRAYFEALQLHVNAKENEAVVRCNFITVEENRVKDFTAGHVSTAESKILIDDLNKVLSKYGIQLYCGDTYKHIAVINGGYKSIQAISPHNAVGEAWETILPTSESASDLVLCEKLAQILTISRQFLENHPINCNRRERGLNPANAISLWSFIKQSKLVPLTTLHPQINRGAIVAGTDLLKGIGLAVGLEPIVVEGATGGYDTNYKGKVEACLATLKTHDFIILHIEASDIASHDGDINLKINTIEMLDRFVIKPIYDAIHEFQLNVSVGILPDHATSSISRKHIRSYVPFIIYDTNHLYSDSVTSFSEESAVDGSLKLYCKDSFIKQLLKFSE